MGLPIGSQIPDFALNDADGKPFRLSEHLGKQPMVIFFYPKDFTPGCTAQACSFRDSYEEFTDKGALVVGISSDSGSSHRRFAEKHRLPFLLLSDPEQKARSLFRVQNRFFNLLPGRETFVIDRTGRLVMAFDSPGAGGHVRRALEAIQLM